MYLYYACLSTLNSGRLMGIQNGVVKITAPSSTVFALACEITRFFPAG